MVEFGNGDVLRFKTSGYEIADVRNPNPPKQWSGIVDGPTVNGYVPLWCEREGREDAIIMVAISNIIENANPVEMTD